MVYGHVGEHFVQWRRYRGKFPHNTFPTKNPVHPPGPPPPPPPIPQECPALSPAIVF